MTANGSTNLSASGRRARFPKSSRLLRHADFERVYKHGKRHFAAHMTVFYLAHGEEGVRIGFTVGRVLGGAVDRNRMKRRLREATRLALPNLPLAADVVINPKKSLLEAEFSEIKGEVAKAFQVIRKNLLTPDASAKQEERNLTRD